jgi:NAD(P)-dependent dehydrogenase (short-subunit alcohol dehydrogenase family)
MVEQAIDRWGKIDIVVNNAGILRDRMFWKMSEEEWDAVLDVHVKGHFCVTRAAINQMKEKGFGRVINFTSTSGLIGNIGQTNYGAAKMAVVGLTRNLALEMQRYGVTVNAISPFAWTRMIGTIPTETDAQKARVEKIKQMSPAHVAPLAVFLASDAAAGISGQIFGVRAKEIILFSLPRPVRTLGRAEGWTPEDLAEIIPGTFESAFSPLRVSAQEFPHDPLV